MGYFSKFPRVRYSFDDGVTNKIAVDILQRVGFKQKTKNDGSLFIDYPVKDGDTPEIVADLIYGNSELHWVILMFNNVINPYTEWYQDSKTIEEIAKRTYAGSVFFVVNHSGINEINDVDFSRNQTVWGVSGNTFSSVGDIIGDNTKRALVSKWDKSLSKISVTGVTGSGTFVVDDYVSSWGVSAADGSTFNIVAQIKRISDKNYNSIHHFEDSSTKYTLNPLGTAPVNNIQDIMGGTAGLSAGGISTGITFGGTLLYDYIINGVNTYSVTNYENEHKNNDELKTIKLIRPDMLQPVIAEFESLMQGR